ncbi:hypothetical protein CO669_09305 [Bradyrhizobium sp. Y36]|nr:hypothetical protein CO669_09305 [Bradyrhizobium sp. Y36]
MPIGAVSADGGPVAVGAFGKSTCTCGDADGSCPLASMLGGAGSDTLTSCIVFRAIDCSNRNRTAARVKPDMPPVTSHRGANQ